MYVTYRVFFLILTSADDKAFFFCNDIAIDFYLVLAAFSWLAAGCWLIIYLSPEIETWI